MVDAVKIGHLRIHTSGKNHAVKYLSFDGPAEGYHRNFSCGPFKMHYLIKVDRHRNFHDQLVFH